MDCCGETSLPYMYLAHHEQSSVNISVTMIYTVAGIAAVVTT